MLFLLIALFGPWFAPYGNNQQIVADARQAPTAAHWFGTDNLGRDVYSRVLLGARDILLLAGLGTLAAVALGTSLGLISGYLGRFFDEVLMRFFDSLLAMPALLLALLLLGTLGPSRNSVLMVIVVVYTPIVARVVRSVVLAVKTKAFVEAARVQGELLPAILFREILPSTLPALAVEASLRFSYAIFLVASLGFLGVGVQPPSPDWGSDGQRGPQLCRSGAMGALLSGWSDCTGCDRRQPDVGRFEARPAGGKLTTWPTPRRNRLRPVLTIEDLTVGYRTGSGWRDAVRGVSLELVAWPDLRAGRRERVRGRRRWPWR